MAEATLSRTRSVLEFEGIHDIGGGEALVAFRTRLE